MLFYLDIFYPNFVTLPANLVKTIADIALIDPYLGPKAAILRSIQNGNHVGQSPYKMSTKTGIRMHVVLRFGQLIAPLPGKV